MLSAKPRSAVAAESISYESTYQMIFAFLEDGGIFTFESAEKACLEFDGVDVESEIVFFFDDSGCSMRPVYDTPNEYGKYLWYFHWCKSGKYHLEADAKYEPEPLDELLNEAQYVDERSDFKSIDQVKVHLLRNR